MLFHSWQYLLFLPAVILGFNLLPTKYRPYFLLLASYVFYASWNAAYLTLIVFSTLIDYACGLAMESGKSKFRRTFLMASLASNLGLLFAFKYLSYAFSLIGIEDSGILPAWVLPVGISFYTFQTMSYSVDVYYRRISAEKNPFHFALYVSFFPQLVAGPIERASSLLPQLKTPKRSTSMDIQEGLALFLWGLMKKVVIADRLAVFSDQVFHPGYQPDSAEALLGMLFFGLQILFDFSAYTDMARGSARCLGIRLMENFANPYGAGSFREFWQRWHISLSTWFRDYLYIPMGGSKSGKIRTQFNLVLTFVISGLWHGAATTFVVWGLMHGLLLIIERYIFYKIKLVPWMQTAITFGGVHLAWVWFRAESTEQALFFYRSLFSFNFSHASAALAQGENSFYKSIILYALTVMVAMAVLFTERKKTGIKDDPLFINRLHKPLWLGGVILLILFFGQWGSSSFIYFQF